MDSRRQQQEVAAFASLLEITLFYLAFSSTHLYNSIEKAGFL